MSSKIKASIRLTGMVDVETGVVDTEPLKNAKCVSFVCSVIMNHDCANPTMSDGSCTCSLETSPLVLDGLHHCSLTAVTKTCAPFPTFHFTHEGSL
eukprot:1215461-Amphidinium_carterae.1